MAEVGELGGRPGLQSGVQARKAFNVMSPKGNAFLANIVDGMDAREAAKKAGISQNTVLRWMGAPEFRKNFYEQLRAPMYVQAARLAKILPGAISRLAQLAATAQDERVAVKASIALVDFGTKMMDAIPELRGGLAKQAPMFVLPPGSKIAVGVQLPSDIVSNPDDKAPANTLKFKAREEEELDELEDEEIIESEQQA